MLNDFDPRERQAIVIILAVLALVITYFYTHPPESLQLPVPQAPKRLEKHPSPSFREEMPSTEPEGPLSEEPPPRYL